MGSNAVVVGGGIGGLCAAIGLRKGGWQVTVLEREQGDTLGAGISLWPNALRGLDELGAGGAVATHLRAQEALGLRNPRGRHLTRSDGTAIERRFGKPLAGIHRADLIAALRQALPESAVRAGAAVTWVSQDGLVHGPEGVLAEADLVVGADGIDSTVRGSILTDPPEPVFSGVTAFRAVTEAGTDPIPGTVLGPGVEFGILPLAAGKLYWWASLTAARARQRGVSEQMHQLAG